MVKGTLHAITLHEKLTCAIGNALAGVTSIENTFRTDLMYYTVAGLDPGILDSGVYKSHTHIK
jgi:hypothetical protein